MHGCMQSCKIGIAEKTWLSIDKIITTRYVIGMNALKIKKKTKPGKSGESTQQISLDGSSYSKGVSPTSGGPLSAFYSSGPVLGLKPIVKPNSWKSAVPPNFKPGIQSLKGGGQPLPATVRLFFAPRFGRNFSQVRVHADSKAVEAAKSIDAKAFTKGKDIVLGAGQYSPATETGKHLLAHELTHVVQQDASTGFIQKKDDYWDISVRGRELEKVPSRFNYEIVDKKLIAHITDPSQIKEIIKLIEILHLYEKKIINKDSIRKDLEAMSKSSKDLDITKYLPANLQLFMSKMDLFNKDVVKYGSKLAKDKGETGVVTPTTIEKKMKKERKSKADIVSKQREWRAGVISRGVSYREFVTVCYAFLAMITSGTATGIMPGEYSSKYSKVRDEGEDYITDALNQSVKGKGPYRVVPLAKVQVGDIAVFRTGQNILGELNFETGKSVISIPKGGAIHTGLVIKVSGNSYGKIELLEKKNPWEAMGTRTVREVLSKYASDKAYVTFLAPVLSGMPSKRVSKLGAKPPTDSYTKAEGVTAPENTHVLFRIDTNITLPHEDIKLLRFVAANKTSATNLNVHGYASVDGPKKYNLNLSAHRAVTVKKTLLKHLLGSSKADAFAHGETSAFGSAGKNRRAGIEIKKPAPPEKKEIPKGSETSQKTGFITPYSTFSNLPRLRLDPRFSALPPSFLVPGKSYFKMTPDYFKLGESYRKRGYTATSKDWESIEKQWMLNYKLFHLELRLSPGIAKKLSDFSTGMLIDQQLYLQRPTESESFEQKWLEQPKMIQVDILELIRLFGKK